MSKTRRAGNGPAGSESTRGPVTTNKNLVSAELTGGGAAELLAIADLHTYPWNPNEGDVPAIGRSLKKFGQWKPITVNRGTLTGRPMEVLAGNHTFEAARDECGWTTIAGWVVDVDEETAASIVAGDNQLAQLATMNEGKLLELLGGVSEENREAAGFSESTLEALMLRVAADAAEAAKEDGEGRTDGVDYTAKITAPQYEIRGDRPDVADLVDRSKAMELMDRINEADLPGDVVAFLLSAATRHYVFRYDRIAEFYAHADPDVQRLMEASALVIIDFENAIREGYVRLSTRLTKLLELELTERDAQIIKLDNEADVEEVVRL